ncbi:MAG: DUF6528 family protein [Clostridium sp.]|nr:DUF6528 family protein [Bacteroides sp.]MCM1197452.1 DUF6528 family protein [Clostridium sp.]
MNKVFLTLMMFVAVACGCEKNSAGPAGKPGIPTLETSTRQLILTEQASNTVCIYDQPTRMLLWQWDPAADGLSESRAKWFRLPDEAKPVYNRSCLLITASNGGCAIVRIKDKKVLFLAKPGGNPHSAEVLPDNSVVCASSEGYLTLWKCDTLKPYASEYVEKIDFKGVHNAVWDAKRNCLWCAGDEEMRSYLYQDGSLVLDKAFALPSVLGHDLVPVYGEDRLLLTTWSQVSYFNPSDCTFEQAPAFLQKNVKSVSTGEPGQAAIYTTPVESWWTNEVLELSSGNRLFFVDGLHIYKARWRAENPFSYPEKHSL